MSLDSQSLLAVSLMALATYATRAAGLWLANRLTLSERVEPWLDYIPGTILVSLVALRTRSLPLAMVVPGVDERRCTELLAETMSAGYRLFALRDAGAIAALAGGRERTPALRSCEEPEVVLALV